MKTLVILIVTAVLCQLVIGSGLIRRRRGYHHHYTHDHPSAAENDEPSHGSSPFQMWWGDHKPAPDRHYGHYGISHGTDSNESGTSGESDEEERSGPTTKRVPVKGYGHGGWSRPSSTTMTRKPTYGNTATPESLTSKEDIAFCIQSCPVTAEYNPVCGSNNVTYQNPGRLECEQKCGVAVTLSRPTACSVSEPATPTRKPINRQDLVACLRKCPFTEEFNPVCGSNNVTYENPGRLLCERNCGVRVEIIKQAPCVPEVTTTEKTLSKEEQISICIRSCSVTSEYNPVCGSNNMTYTNLGRLECAQNCGTDVYVTRYTSCIAPLTEKELANRLNTSTTESSQIETSSSTTTRPYINENGNNNFSGVNSENNDNGGGSTGNNSNGVINGNIDNVGNNLNGGTNGYNGIGGNIFNVGNNDNNDNSFAIKPCKSIGNTKNIENNRNEGNDFNKGTYNGNEEGSSYGNHDDGANNFSEGTDKTNDSERNNVANHGDVTNNFSEGTDIPNDNERSNVEDLKGGSYGNSGNRKKPGYYGNNGNQVNNDGNNCNNGNSASLNKVMACMQLCSLTSEHNPVCGSDGITYTNPGRLLCAQFCGIDVRVKKFAPCSSQSVTNNLCISQPAPECSAITNPPAPVTVKPTTSPSPTQACIQSCTASPEYNPVCGSNNVTYRNKEQLQCARRCGVVVTLESDAECSLKPSTSSPPVWDNTYKPSSPAEIQECVKHCSVEQKYEPICGSNGVTYNNTGHLICARQCGLDVRVKHVSPCTNNIVTPTPKPENQVTNPGGLDFTIPQEIIDGIWSEVTTPEQEYDLDQRVQDKQ